MATGGTSCWQGARGQLLAVSLALLGGIFGLLGALLTELRYGGGVLLLVIGAPVVEEVLKPLGVYVLLWRCPQLILGAWHSGFLAAISGIVFGLVESTLYVNLYVEAPTGNYTAFRYSVPVMVHGLCSFLAGLGVSPGLRGWVEGRGPLPARTRNLFLSAVALHALYNLTGLALEAAGIISF